MLQLLLDLDDQFFPLLVDGVLIVEEFAPLHIVPTSKLTPNRET